MSLQSEIAKEIFSRDIIRQIDNAIIEGKYDKETLEWVKTIVYYEGY